MTYLQLVLKLELQTNKMARLQYDNLRLELYQGNAQRLGFRFLGGDIPSIAEMLEARRLKIAVDKVDGQVIELHDPEGHRLRFINEADDVLYYLTTH